MSQISHCQEYGRYSRREFIWRGLQGSAGLLWGSMIAPWGGPLPKIALADPHMGPRGDTLVCIFLRGGADGLNMVVPFGDDAYYHLRPNLAIPRPDDRSADSKTIDLDGYFGLHPALAALTSLYQAGDLALIQATGSPDETRSHFAAMDLMERGAVPGAYTGWLGRHLASLDTGNDSPLRGLAIEDRLPLSLAGAAAAVPIPDLERYDLHAPQTRQDEYRSALNTLFELPSAGLLQAAAAQTFEALALINRVAGAGSAGASTRRTRGQRSNPFTQSLLTVSRLIHADVGVEVATVDYGGWDTHVGQGGAEGQMANLLTELGEGIAAFYEDLGEKRDQVTVVVMSEFGRRVEENAGEGTDHGHGNMMMVVGGQINGGRVYSSWPGLDRDVLVGPGDLAITTDYRSVLGELLSVRLNNPRVADVFPDYSFTAVGVAS